jgi:hypothetical protein
MEYIGTWKDAGDGDATKIFVYQTHRGNKKENG